MDQTNMTIDKAIETGLVKVTFPWYNYTDASGAVTRLGKSKRDAQEKLTAILKESSPEGAAVEDSAPSTPPPKAAEIIESIEKSQETEQNPYEALMSDVVDISKFREGTDFDIHIWGVDSRLYRDKRYLQRNGIKDCPYYFEWFDTGAGRGKLIETVGQDGTKKYNANGRSVLLKSKIVDPRTGKRWLEVRRDDTPTLEYITVGTYVLCYCLANQWQALQEEQMLKNTTRTSEMADARIEHGKNMAKLSKQDPIASKKGFQSVNSSDTKSAAEFLGQGNQAIENEAAMILSDLDKLETTGDVKSAEQRIAQLKQDVASGRTSESIKGSRVITVPT